MASKSTNKSGSTVVAMILSSYLEYCSLGYPEDPNIYELRVSGETYQSLIRYIQNIAYPGSGCSWPFKVVEDSKVPDNEVVFGPEQITILWRDKNGM